MYTKKISIKKYTVFIFVMILFMFYVWGYFSHRNQIFPYQQLRKINVFFLNIVKKDFPEKDRFNDLSSKTEIKCSKLAPVILVTGQSNSANHYLSEKYENRGTDHLTLLRPLFPYLFSLFRENHVFTNLPE